MTAVVQYKLKWPFCA